MKLRIYLILCACWAAFSLHAQEDSLRATRYVMRSVLYGVGMSNVLDTYLSPLEYKGPEIRILRENMRMTRLMNGNVSAQNLLQANVSYTHNPSQTANMYAGLVNWTYALHYQFRLNEQLKLLVGPMIDLNGGFVYNTRNSNNPAQAKAYGSVGISGMAIYSSVSELSAGSTLSGQSSAVGSHVLSGIRTVILRNVFLGTQRKERAVHFAS